MKLEVNIEKRYAYILIGLLVLIGGFFVIGAAVDKSVAYHDASSVEVNIGGTTKSLQDAITAGDIGGAGLQCPAGYSLKLSGNEYHTIANPTPDYYSAFWYIGEGAKCVAQVDSCAGGDEENPFTCGSKDSGACLDIDYYYDTYFRCNGRAVTCYPNEEISKIYYCAQD